MFIPVVDKDNQPLMPTKPSRARRWIQSGKATSFWKNGIFCVRLNVEPSDTDLQDIVVGVDPGSKKEGFTIKSEAHTYLNVQADAHNKVGRKLEKRREARRSRRSRKCPNRKNRMNRLANRKRIPAGTRARWDWKLRILDWLAKMYPISHVCVEDIKAKTIQHARKWNQSFSPLEVGKQWFYAEIGKRWCLLTLQGFETKEIRDRLGLKKSKAKFSETFDAHCVDSWCLAYHGVGGADKPDNTNMFFVSPILIKRRELHRRQESKGRKRHKQGGTVLGNGFVKNTIIKHQKWGLVRLSGVNASGLFSIYDLEGKKRLTTGIKLADFCVLTRLNFNYKGGHSSLC